jgi:toxin ParE1/3/4
MRVVYLSIAVQDLMGILTFLEAENLSASRKVGQRLKETLHRLIPFPHQGKAGRVLGTRELSTALIGRTVYIIIYRIRHEQVQILRVLAGGQDIDATLEEGFP